MHDIWAFLLQTLTVSLVALFLLVLKTIFQDKLSPRWQYGVWLILAARVLIPAGVGGQMFLPLERWVELLKLAAEVRLSSAYTGVWAATAVTAPFPRITAAPQSVTDWLFCLYAAGAALSLLWFREFHGIREGTVIAAVGVGVIIGWLTPVKRRLLAFLFGEATAAPVEELSLS